MNNRLDDIFEKYSSSINGLDNKQIEINKNEYGENSLPKQKKITFLERFFAQFKNIMIIILLISSGISIYMAIASDEGSGFFEGITILFIVIINSLIGALQEKKADNCIESLKSKNIKYCNVVRNGKLHQILSTELVVGDIVHLGSGEILPADMILIESNMLLIDESLLTGESHHIEKRESKSNIIDKDNKLFAGTSITRGKAVAIVTEVGINTEMGKIAKTLLKKNKNLSPLELSIKKIGKIITIVVMSIVVLMFVLELCLKNDATLMSSFMMAIALAVSAIPESLPAVIIIIMALGMQNLAKKGSIIRQLRAVETLGCCNIICSDKTGTITTGKMEVIEHFCFDDSNIKILKLASILCNDCYEDEENIIGEPTEKALYNFAKKDNEIQFLNFERIDESPFESNKKLMSVLIDDKYEKTTYTKGAVESVLSICEYRLSGNEKIVLSTKDKTMLYDKANDMSENALRVIALCYKNSDSIDEKNMIFLGLVGIIDPPREEVKRSIEKCKNAGMQTIMITGDHLETAFAIAKKVGITTKRSEIISGAELAKMSDEKLFKKINKIKVYARVSPDQKQRIVKLLQSDGNIVAMTGDGVNDASGIKQADIGIGMAQTGSDVVKNVADMLLTDDNFATIVVAVEEGRKIYQNIQKSIQFLLSTNLVEVLTLLFTILFLPDFVFLIPVQILFINLVTDTLPALALGVEPAERDVMKIPPRKNGKNLLDAGVGRSIIYQSILQSIIVLVVMFLGLEYYTAEQTSTMCFFTIIFMQTFHSINCKTNGSLFNIKLFQNKIFNICFLITIALNLSVVFIPVLSNIMSIVPLNFSMWITVIIASLIIIPIVDIIKIIRIKTRKYTIINNKK